jgi:predicted dehydrogenase
MLDRRRWLLAAASVGRILGANQKIGVGVIGAGGRGRYLIATFKEDPAAELRAVCDIYEPNLQRGLAAAGTQAKSYDDYLRLLADKDIEAVVIATPDHWHAQMILDAVAAGKDVYVEKPMAHTVEEGFRVVDAVRKSGRVVQVGTQRRSYDLFLEGKRLMDSGRLGQVHLVTAWWVNHQASLRSAKLEGKLDWKRWLGSAPSRPLNETRFFNWYYFWDYSGGLMVGQAAHVIDAIHWFMNASFPSAVTCSAARTHLAGAEVPETTSMTIEYPEDFVAVFSVGYRAMRYAPANDQIKQFHGTKARLDMCRESFALYPESRDDILKPEVERKQFGSFERASRAHIANFLDCVRTRRPPNAPVEAGNSTNVVLCLAMEALRTGRRIRWNSALRRMES